MQFTNAIEYISQKYYQAFAHCMLDSRSTRVPSTTAVYNLPHALGRIAKARRCRNAASTSATTSAFEACA